ncbi:hypothetical protein FRUB_03923 [Fimbriiglobus ruber]|uniref:Uncharacterized protein n=1 Tax=Fimbriiglobus ruber TaxID=1908690 RepID=A0A225DZP6_9BACT|nr:hypothetical protein FRUB_03923 [Fimbriiglobus ruber]
MSSTLLDRAFGFRQYDCVRTTTADGVLTLHLRQDPTHDRCSYYQSPDVIRRGSEERTVRTVPIGGRRTAIATKSSSASAFSPYTAPSTFFSDEPFLHLLRRNPRFGTGGSPRLPGLGRRGVFLHLLR